MSRVLNRRLALRLLPMIWIVEVVVTPPRCRIFCATFRSPYADLEGPRVFSSAWRLHRHPSMSSWTTEGPVESGRLDQGSADTEEHTDERLGVLLPTQLVQRSRLSPARALMLAVIEDAAICYSRRGDPRPQERLAGVQAERWIRAEGETWLFSFDVVCRELSFDPGELRRKLLRQPPRQSDRRQRRSHRVVSGVGQNRSVGSRVREILSASAPSDGALRLRSRSGGLL